MREWRHIVALSDSGTAKAMVTLVRLQGSSYRRVGARMLVATDGTYAGSISGGCLEAEVARKAAWLTRSAAVVEQYSTLFDDTAEVPYGLGCGGTVDLLFEPAGTPEFATLIGALRSALNGSDQRVVTCLPEGGNALTRYAAAAHAPPPAAAPATRSQSTIEELLKAPQRLFVVGAGDDAQPLVQMANLLGWNVTVIDGRAPFARAQRFPGAASVLVAQSIPQTVPQSITDLRLGSRDAAVIMTHSFEQDRNWLTALLPLKLRYLGLLGARHRSALLVAESAARLHWTVDQACAGLFAPVGLDLGGEGAEAIALAVVAEVQACCQGKLGISRRMTAELVAGHIAQGGSSRYLQTQCAV